MQKIKILLSFAALGICLSASAVSAYPGVIRYLCSDGSYVNLWLKGDEHCKWAVTEDGSVLMRDSVGEWCYADVDLNGEPCASHWKLSTLHSKGLDDFLQKLPEEIKPGMRLRQQQKEVVGSRNGTLRVSAVGEQRTLVILMQYKDVSFKKTRDDYDALFNIPGYREDGALGSVKDFYRENSYGRLDLTCDVLGPFTALHEMEYYGGNDKRDQDMHPEELFMEALENISGKVDLATYDAEGDGVLNNIHIIFAGYGEEAGAVAEAIWSHEAIFAEPMEVNGIKITGYSCAPELRGYSGNGISRIGVHCHEMGHSFGALDFYDTDYDKNGEFSGTGKWDLMASGSWNNGGISPAHFNPYVKMLFGWVECETLDKGQEKVILPPAFGNNKIYRINTDVEGDFFLLENRQQMGFDEALPGNGLMIYHILPEIIQRSTFNTINSAFPQTCYPVCAGAGYEMPDRFSFSYGDVDSPQCPFPGTSSADKFTEQSVPASLAADGSPARVGLTDIRQEENGDVSFKVSKRTISGGQELLFSDSFERNVPAWTLEKLKGNVSWEVYQPDLTTTMPVAADGERYLAMRGERVSGTLSVSRSISPMITGAYVGETKLSFFYRNLKFLSKHGALKVLYKATGQSDWLYLQTLPNVIEDWKQYRIDLPVTGADFQIAFEGEMEAGFIMVDDVKVYSDVATSTALIPTPPVALACYGMKGKVGVESDKSARISIYDLAGKTVYSSILNKGMNTIEMKPGLYIGVSGSAVSKFYVY